MVKLVLLHPLPLGRSMWTGLVRDLAMVGGNDVVSPDLYDFGDDLRAWARGVVALCGGDDELVVVGNSVGGSCAIEVARLVGPARVRAIVLSGAKAGHDPEPAFRDEALRMLAAEDGIDAAWDRYWRPLFGPGVDEAIVERARSMAVAQGAARVADGVRAFHGRPSRDDFLDTWTGPVWVVSGEHDVRPARSREMAERLAHGTYREVPDVGHYVAIEAPDAFAAVVAEALSDR